MIRNIVERQFTGGLKYIEAAGLSTDTKPTGNIDGRPIINGSTFIEMDTGEVYWFDEAAGEWIK